MTVRLIYDSSEIGEMGETTNMAKKRILAVLLILCIGAGALFIANQSSKRTERRDATAYEGISESEKYAYAVTPIEEPRDRLRQKLISMRLGKDATPFDKIRFNSPAEFSTLDDPKFGVFHPEGGNAKYKLAGGSFMKDGSDSRWLYNTEFRIEGEGTEEGTELIAFLVGVKQSICSIINKKYEIKGIPRLQSDQSNLYMKNMIDDGMQDYVVQSSQGVILDNLELSQKLSGCFQTHDGKNYVAFFMILER
ncbi:MAG TPA: hypothetical protein PLF01_03115 [Alphaproteobacteria bacterium]|nr:hypothetical protein [Alphaproteobacteria bacterium]